MTFEDCLTKCVGNKELVQQFDRLTGSNLCHQGVPVDLAVDKATGRIDSEFMNFVDFVFEFVYMPLNH